MILTPKLSDELHALVGSGKAASPGDGYTATVVSAAETLFNQRCEKARRAAFNGSSDVAYQLLDEADMLYAVIDNLKS